MKSESGIEAPDLAAPFLPMTRMAERVKLARDDSDSAYFFELCYMAEMTLKLLVIELLAAMQDDRDLHRYTLEHRLVRADSMGEWAEVLDEALTGPASQHLVAAGRDSQGALAAMQSVGQDSWQRRALMHLNSTCRCVDSHFEDISGQRASLRQWVRQFVWLRNRTRGHGAPMAASLSAACPDLQASIDEILNNAPAFRRSWAHLRRSLSGKYKVSLFGGGRDPYAYLAREAGHAVPDGTYVMLDLPSQANLLFTDTDLSDFFIPNGNYRDGKFEVLSFITDDRRTQDGSSYILPTQAQPKSETKATPQLDIVGRVFSNMPPRREGYVQREALQLELEQLLCDDRHPVITLQGRGGVGKTSLAIEVLHKLSNKDDFFAMIWFSARDIDLLPQGPRIVRADVLSTEDVARDFAGLMLSPEKPKLDAAMKYFTDCLSGKADDGPFIFVLDNFETIRDQAELYLYLDNAVRPPNKVLITTRTRDFKADYPIEVRGMTREEFAMLVAETSAHLGISHLIDSAYEEQIFEESDGHPYITKVLLGEVAREKRKMALQHVVAAKDAVLDALFDRSFAAMSPAAQRVFLTLCSWRSLVPRVGLAAVLLRPGNAERLDVDRALDELEQRSLVEFLQEEGTEETYLSVPLAASVFGKKKLVTSPLKTAIDADLELIRGFGAASTTDLARGLGPRVDRLAKVAASRTEKDDDLSEDLAVIEYIATEYPPAWLVLAELQEYQLGHVEAAIHSVNRYLEARQSDGKAWEKLIHLYNGAGDPLGEMHARLQLAELEPGDLTSLSSAANRLNGLLYNRKLQLDADERLLIVRKLRSLMEARYREADATDLSRLAWLCFHDRDEPAAERWAEAGLRIDPANSYCLSLKRKITGS